MEKIVITPRRNFEIVVSGAENDANDDDLKQEVQRGFLNPIDDVDVENFLHPNVSMSLDKIKPPDEIHKFLEIKIKIKTDTKTNTIIKADNEGAVETSPSLKTLRKKNKSPFSCTCSVIF